MRFASTFIGRVLRLIKLSDPPAWSSPAIVILGLVVASLEGLSLYLFIPLIQSLGGSDVDEVNNLFDRLDLTVSQDRRVALLVLAVCTAVLLKNIVGFLNSYLTRFTGGLVAHRMRLRVFEQAISSCVDYRVQNRRTDIVNTLTTETWKVSSGLILVYRLIVCVCTCAVFIGLLLLISIKLTMLAMLYMVGSAAVVHFATHRADASGRRAVADNKQFGLRMWESVNALRLIRSFTREDYEIQRFARLSQTIQRRLLQLDMLWALPGPLAEILATILIGLLILTGSMLGTGFAVLAAFLAVLYRMQAPVREILSSKVALDSLNASVADVDEFIDRTRQPYIRSGKKRIAQFQHEIEFRNVSFRYAPEEPLALENISFKILAGSTTAIVGRSGAGKSTLMTLLFRFEDPTSGEILIDGTPLSDLDLASWRARLSLMSQDVWLFNETIETNIAYGDLAAPAIAVRNAAAVAGADEFIRDLPQGYATEVGDQGMRLSGGQRQRIALARTILRNPDILMLDEATNALDGETEAAFQDALEMYAHGRTVIVIAHRLATVANADHVIVLENGRVAESGPPALLLRSEGPFARLHGLQLGKMAAGG